MKPPCPHCLGRHTTVSAAMICADLAKEYREVHDAHMAAVYSADTASTQPATRRKVYTINLGS